MHPSRRPVLRAAHRSFGASPWALIACLLAAAAAPPSLAFGPHGEWPDIDDGSPLSRATRQLMQSYARPMCPGTSSAAYRTSPLNPYAYIPSKLDPYGSPKYTSCRTWQDMRIVYTDVFSNVVTGEIVTKNFTMVGQITEPGYDACSSWASRGHYSAATNSTSDFLDFLSTFMDKPYDPGSPSVPTEDQVCLETWITSSERRTSNCAGSYLPWRLNLTYVPEWRYSRKYCCDYYTCNTEYNLTAFQPYLVSAALASTPIAPPINGTGGGYNATNGTSSGSSSSKTGAIVGAVVGVIGGIGLLVGLIVFFVCRNRSRNNAPPAVATAAVLGPGKASGSGAGIVPGGYPGAGGGGVTSHDGVALISVPAHPQPTPPPGSAPSSSFLPPPAWGPGTSPSGPQLPFPPAAAPGQKYPSVSISTTSAYNPHVNSVNASPFAAQSALGPMASKFAGRGSSGGGVGSGAGSAFSMGGGIGAGLQPLPEAGPVSLGDTGVMTTRGTSGAVTTTQGGVSTTQGSLTSTTSSQGQAGSVISNRSASSQLVLADHMRIRHQDLRDFVQIGQGGFGNVFKCRWQGHQVVVKMLRADVATDKLRAALIREALLMRELQNPGIARVYGVVDEAPHHALVMQLYKRGTLEEYMSLPATCAQYNALSVRERLRIAEQVADGMAYLHQRSPPIIHGDLKAANLLVDEDTIAITDFGLAVQLMTSGHGGAATGLEPARTASSSLSNLYSTLWTSPTLALSVFISPPEVLSNPNAPRSTATDVYAFGITLLQIMTGRMPYKGLTADMVVNMVKSGKRPPVPETLPFGVRRLIEECWAQDPAARPAMPAVAQRIKVEMAAVANATLTATTATTTTTRFFR